MTTNTVSLQYGQLEEGSCQEFDFNVFLTRQDLLWKMPKLTC